MKKGDIVKIYEDPLTQTKLEGEAKLIKKINEHNFTEFWQVKFLSDGFVAQRVVKKEVK